MTSAHWAYAGAAWIGGCWPILEGEEVLDDSAACTEFMTSPNYSALAFPLPTSLRDKVP